MDDLLTPAEVRRLLYYGKSSRLPDDMPRVRKSERRYLYRRESVLAWLQQHEERVDGVKPRKGRRVA